MVNEVVLSDLQKQIFDKISGNDVAELKILLAQLEGSVDFVDENDMTPLQYACYKKNIEIVQLLIDMGANVNLSKHGANYSALHFGALSGSVDICLILLRAGANKMAVNSVSRNPAQMAAFVGNHAVVATINNFVPKSDIEYYTKIQGLQTEPYLLPMLLDSFHKFVINSNMHPVRIALNLQKYSGLMYHLKMIKKVLGLMADREMHKKNEVNEVMSFKYHYLGWIVQEVLKCRENFQQRIGGGDSEVENDKIIELLSKRMLKENKNGQLDYMEFSIRECVREYEFRECTIFRQIVSQLSSKDTIHGLDVIKTAINGQRGFVDFITYCSTCGEEKPDKKCSKCKEVQYCHRECQRLHWFMHKKSCARRASSPVQSQMKELKLDNNKIQDVTE